MARRKSISSDSGEGLEPSLEIVEVSSVSEEVPVLEKDTGVWLVNLYPAIVLCTGPVTGSQYTFNGAGARVKVDRKDTEVLLARQQPGGSCCGGSLSPMFELA
jgi:hypothetical protein